MPGKRGIVADQVTVGPGGAGGRATQLFGQSSFDRKVWIHPAGPNVFIAQASLRAPTSGFQLPSGVVQQFDLPAGEELWAITSAGNVAVSRYWCPVMPTIGEALEQLLQNLLTKLEGR